MGDKMSWTKEDLQELVKTKLAGRLFIVVSNREPYIHNLSGDEIQCIVPASGLTVALDPVMRACGGVWIAHGSGSADREVVDDRNRVSVPPDEPRYTLRRVWLTKEEEEGYYLGFSNEALWPLGHIAYTWPNPEAFRICPWGKEILDSLLGNDMLGFHIKYHCDNFMETVRLMLESRVDHERSAVSRGGKATLVRPFPISVDFNRIARDAAETGV